MFTFLVIGRLHFIGSSLSDMMLYFFIKRKNVLVLAKLDIDRSHCKIYTDILYISVSLLIAAIQISTVICYIWLF